MAIARPVTKTVISTTAFGIPVADGINALAPTLIYGKANVQGAVAVPDTGVFSNPQALTNAIGNGMSASGSQFWVARPGKYLVVASMLYNCSVAPTGVRYMQVQGRVNTTAFADSFVGITGVYYGVTLVGVAPCNQGDGISIWPATNITGIYSDARSSIVVQWIGE